MDPVPFVDTHVHFWDLKHPSLSYDWLAADAVHPILGDIDAIKMVRYEGDHWWAEARFANVRAAVHVQAAVGTADPVEETRWLTEVQQRTGYPNAVVAHTDLARADVAAVLDAHLESPLMRGVRDFGTEPQLASGAPSLGFERGLRELAARQLVLDLDCEWQHMAAAAELAGRHPDLVIVLEHLGFPRARDDGYFRSWSDGIRSLGAAPNVYCKVSGVGMKDPLWTVDSIRPWVRHCVESFGPDRCLFGSNWPVDRLFSSYDAIVDAYRRCLVDFTSGEQVRMLSENAGAVYRV